MTGWTPLKFIKHGKVVIPFLPLDKPKLARMSENFCNVYPGDEVYIIEENGTQWGRGYVVTQANPSDFSSAVIDLNKLPEQKVRIAIVPLAHIRVIAELDFVNDVTDKNLAKEVEAINNVPSMLDTEISSDTAVNGYDTLLKAHKKPALPSTEKDDDLIVELKSATTFLTSHIYAMYSLGEFHLFNKLIVLYNELEEVRIILTKKLCTKKEDVYLRRHASTLLTKIPKFLAATEKLTRYDEQEKHKLASSDVSAYQAVIARNPHNGELLDYNSLKSPVTPSDVAMNQISYALSGSYPVNEPEATLAPQSKGILDRASPVNIMVDFEAVSGSTKNVPKGYKGMTAYLYLRNKKKRLTEAFAVQVDSDQELLLENVSAALFKNIPPSEIDNNGKVYLVAVLAEEVDISYVNRDLKIIKKGIAAGVTDVSRIISGHKGALASGESHQFTIKLYGSFITPHDNVNASPATKNNGWGELVERIIHGSSIGVAVNPRAESLTVSVKEIKNRTMSDENFETSKETALTPIRTISYDPLSSSNEKIYLRLNTITLTDPNNASKNAYLSLHINLSNPEHSIVKGSNQLRTPTWKAVSVVPDEVIGEVLSIGGIAKNVTDSKNEDYATFSVYSNGELKAEGKFIVKKGGIVSDTDGNNIPLPLHTTSGSVFGTITFTTDYIGTRYNIDKALETILHWKENGTTDLKSRPDLLEALTNVSKQNLQQLLRHFTRLTVSFFELFEQATKQSETDLEAMIFDALVHMFDVLFGKQDQYIYAFEEFCNTHQSSTTAGSGILLQASQLLSYAESDWTQIGRQFCRVSLFIFKMAIVCNKNEFNSQLANSIKFTNESLLQFLSLNDFKYLSEQVAIIDGLNYYFDSISKVNSDSEIWLFFATLMKSLGTRGLGLKEEAEAMMAKHVKGDTMKSKNDASSTVVAKKKKDEHRLIISKIILIRKILHSRLLETSQRDLIISSCIEWSLEVLLGSYDIDASRLASGNIAKIFGFVWHNTVLTGDTNSWYLVRCITRLLPVFAKIFIKYNKYCKVQGVFKSKRTYTNFFQMEYPFVEHTMDSIVTKETFVELLVELATLISYITRFSKHCINIETGFDALELTPKDEEFMKSNYYTKNLSDANIISLIQLSKIIYDSHFFPADKWLSLYAVFIESAFSVLEMLKSNMTKQFIPPSELSENFNTSIWGNYLRTVLKMTTSKPAATCQLCRIARNGCIKITGDLRQRGADLVEQVWNELGWDAVDEDVLRFQLKKFTGYQSEFLSSDYSILRDLMLLYLQRHERCQIVGVQIFWTIIASECILNEDGLAELAKESITGLYDLFHSDGYKPVVQEIRTFVKLLKITIKIDPEDVAYKQISSFVENLTDFLFILNDLRNVPYSDEFDDDRTFHKLNILGFLLSVNQPELLYQFIDDMYQGSLSKGNYVQAALSLDLLASTYDWSLHTLLPPSSRPYFPQQTPFKRKELLYRMIGHNFTKGNALEQAVEIYNELRDAYDNITLDLKGLSYVNSKLSKIFADLQNPDRIMPSYFKVSYIGSGFPVTLRGKHFIHQGLPFEQLSSIQDRLSRLHPGSRILTKESELVNYTEHVPIGKYLYINSVEPGKGFDAQNSLVSYSARLYVQNKELKHFASVKRLPNATGIHDLWSEEVIYQTYETFPALMNRSEIKETVLNRLSPIENAYRLIVTKNHDLANIVSMIETAVKEKEDTSSFFGDLSRQVSGTVDAPVNGGIGQYRVFFTDKFASDDLEYKESCLKLQKAFNDLAIILNRCLEWHGKLLTSSKLKDSHSELLRLYKINFKPEINELKLIIRDTTIEEDSISVLNGYSASVYSSDDDNSSVSRTRTNASFSSNGTSTTDLTSTMTKSSIQINNGSSNANNSSSGVSTHSGSNMSTASKNSGSRRLMTWRQSRFG